MRLRRLGPCFALLVGGFIGCSSGSSSVQPTDDAGADASTPDAGGVDAGTVKGGQSLALTASPASTFVVAGSTTTVTITRTGSSGTAVALAVAGLPTGVTAAPATIDASQMSTTVTLTAAANASPVAAATITVTGTTPTKTANATFKLAVHGAPGTLDTSWGTAGVTKGLGEIGTQATGIGFQKSGLPVVGGYVGVQYAVARYTTTGVLDSTFGTKGKTYLAVPNGANNFVSMANALVIDANDLIYQAGSISGGNAPSQQVRYTAGGVADGTWGTAGIADIVGAMDLHATVLDSMGKVLIGGHDKLQSGCTYRTTTTGGPDSSWGIDDGSGDYCADTDVNTTVYAPQGLALQSGGRVIAVGSPKPAGQASTGAFIAGISSTGSVDTNFGTMGRTLTTSSQWTSVAVQQDDSIVAAGYQMGGIDKFCAARFTKAGAPDTTFNDTGVATITVGDSATSSQANGVAIQSDGKVVLAGNATSSGRSVMAIVRLDSKGALDKTFGPNGGIVLLPVATTTAGANAVAIGPDGMIYVVGHGDNDFAVARFWP